MRALRLPRLPRRPQPPSNCVETIAPMVQPLLRERRVCADGMPAASLAVGRALSEKWTNGRDARRERNARRCNLMLAASLLSLFSSAFAGAGVLPALPHSQRRNCPIAWNLCFFLANLKHPRFRHSLIQLCAVCFFFFSFFFDSSTLSLPCSCFYTALSPRSFDHYACCGLSRSDPRRLCCATHLTKQLT